MVCVMQLWLGYYLAKPKSVPVKSFTTRSVTTEHTLNHRPFVLLARKCFIMNY